MIFLNEYTDILTSLFERQFSETYLKITNKKRKQLFPFLSTIFRRWYYSALVEATSLTPANMMASVSEAHNRDVNCYPSVSLRSKSKWIGINSGILEYSLTKHPITDDLRAVVAYCSPSIDLFDEDCFSDEQAIELGYALSIQDPHYASFLLEIAFRMNLFNKLPSIYANHIQVRKESEQRLAVSDEALLDEIIETTIRLSAYSLNNMIPLPKPVFTEAFIRSLLNKPMITDEIFECVYDTLGFSLDELFDEDIKEDFDDFDTSVLSGTYYTGVFLDKFFFTPFSYFLKLIRPVYVLPFDFQQEFKYFFEAPVAGEEIASIFYSPCSKYTFTDLGLKYFNITATPENYIDAASFIPFENLQKNLFSQKQILDSLPIWGYQPLPEGFPFVPVTGRLLTFKIKLLSEPVYWIHIDMNEESTLHRLYMEVTRYFYFARNDDYSFFHGETENPFTEYAIHKKTRRAKYTPDIPLSELDLEFNRTLLLLVNNQGDERRLQTFRLTIEFLGDKPKEPRTSYPVVSKMSKAIRALHENDEDDEDFF